MDGESSQMAAVSDANNASFGCNPAIQAQSVEISGTNVVIAGHDVHYYEMAKKDLMSFLDPIDNFRRIQQDTLSKATPETGEWIFELETFPAWWDPKGAVKTMWGSGIPGAGKTVLTSIVINGVEKRAKEMAEEICIGYIYIRYSDNAGLTVRHCLEVLVKQTIEKHPGCLVLAERVYAEHIRLKTRPTEEELLQLLKSFTMVVTAIFFFLDALDEAPPELQFNLVEKLSSLNVKLFITSRALKLLQERFPSAHHFSITAQDSDLELHINSKLNKGQELCKVLEQGGASLRADVVASVKEKCGGMFLHASLQLAALQHCASVHNVREMLATFPPNIEDVYSQTWARIVGQASSNGIVVQNCLIWVLNAPKSMRVAELQHAAAVCLETHKLDPDRIVHIDTIVSLCRGLLVVDEETNLVRLVHYTAKEPLERLILKTFPRLHSLMAALCIGRLIHHGFQAWKGKYRHSLERVMKADPLLPYAYHAWSRHALNSLDDPLMVTKVKAFVRSCQSFPLEEDYYVQDLLNPLHVVAFFNLPISLAGSLVITTFDPNRRTKWRKYTPLHLACRHPSHFNTIQELLSLRLVDVNAAERWKKTPLICAAESGNVEAVKHLLAHPKIRLDLRDEDGLTAFTGAAWKGNEAVVKAILAHSPGEIHSTDGEGRTALSRACERGHLAMVNLLLSYSQSVTRLADNDGRTLLSRSASLTPRSIDTFKHILSLAQDIDDINLADENGRTPLSWASSDGGEETVKVLLAHPGTDVNQTDNGGRTPLSWALRLDREGAAKVLLANPLTNVNLADTGGWTPLIWASRSYCAGSMRALLAHPQIGVNLQDNQGRTALISAARCRKFEGVKLLLAHPDIKVNLPDKEGRTPLIWATIMEGPWRQAIIQVLLAHPQTDVNLADNQGRTGLSWASQRGHEDVVKLLLAHPEIGASHRPDNQGRTPLGWASKEGHNKIAELLLAHSPIQPESEPEPEPEPDRGLSSMLDSAVQKVHRLWRR